MNRKLNLIPAVFTMLVFSNLGIAQNLQRKLTQDAVRQELPKRNGYSFNAS